MATFVVKRVVVQREGPSRHFGGWQVMLTDQGGARVDVAIGRYEEVAEQA